MELWDGKRELGAGENWEREWDDESWRRGGTLSPTQSTVVLSQACPAALGFALHSCPVGMRGSSEMSTVLPKRVWPRSSWSWEVTGACSMGMRQAYVPC